INTLFLSQIPSVKEVQKDFKIGVIGRNYPHKNLKILPRILDILNVKFESKVAFYVTLTNEEFTSMNSSFQKKIINYGSLKVSECPKFYDEMDLIFFPSLLEVFSATPLESLYMKKPLVCSDLSFNKGYLEDFVFYTKPDHIKDSAKVLIEVLKLLKSNDQCLINKLNSRVVILGGIYEENKLKNLFEEAICCISPNQAGLSVLKSFGYGVPFITKKNSITGGERLNIIDCHNGILYNTKDELFQIINNTESNKDFYYKMGLNAMDYYESGYTIDNMKDNFVKAIENTLI
ncbi:glycosyltransferase, partial [Flavobacteriaceae bacterium]|nr:glycosyltransferase [Flavobacteriaceae bacterium]